jgi:hypothetical protein
MWKRPGEGECEQKVCNSSEKVLEDADPVKDITEPAETEVGADFAPIEFVRQLSQTTIRAPATPLAIEDLLLRMRAGDRVAAAEFLMRYGSRIRRRIRGKLGPAIRRLFDSLEILSTLGRRLDLYVMSGRLQATNETQLWGLLFKMADNALIDKARLFKRLQLTEGEDYDFARELSSRLHEAEETAESGVEIEIDNCLRVLGDPIDRRILSMWLTGESHRAIAEHVELAPTAVRKRWEKIKHELKGRLQAAAA